MPVGIVALLGALVAGGPAGAAARADTTPPPARSLDELRHQLDSIRRKYRVPGVGLALVTRDSTLWAGGLGSADLARDRSVTAETHFRVGSISKSFVALGILRLVADGRLRLDAPVRSIAPELVIENPWEATRPITVANLLEHTAGFDDMHFNEMYVKSKQPDLPMRDVLSINPASRRVRWEPGTRFSYSNPGYGVAGYLIEKVTGLPYDRVLRDSILTPLGMKTASFELTDQDTASISQGYSGSDRTPVGYPHIYLRPAGNLHCSPAELARLVRLLINRGTIDSVRLFAPEVIDRMERTETTTLASLGVQSGYGLANYHTLAYAVPVHGHDGGIDGFVSNYAYSSEAGVGWVVLVNGGEGQGYGELVNAVARFMLRDVAAPAKPSVAATAADLAPLAGYYRPASPRSSLFRIADDLLGGVRIIARGDSLFEKPFRAAARPLVPTGPRTFRLTSEPVGSRGFAAVGGGMVYAGPNGYWERASAVPWMLELGALVLAAILMATGVVYALGWIPRRLRGRIGAGPATQVRGWPLAAVLTIVAFFVVALKYGLRDGGTLNVASAGLFVIGLLIPVVALVALVRTARADGKRAGPVARRFGMALAIACLGIAAWLGTYGFIGMRTWRD
jgi:CubicO group peptidase (beta-lactamase class C family)